MSLSPTPDYPCTQQTSNLGAVTTSDCITSIPEQGVVKGVFSIPFKEINVLKKQSRDRTSKKLDVEVTGILITCVDEVKT